MTCKSARGMTLIDVIVGTFIMLVVFLGLFGAFKISIELVFSTKAKIGAVSLLTDRLEYIRGLPYATVGTEGGIPAGDIPQIEQTALNGITYTINTLIQYTDAEQDGLDVNDENSITADYKTVKVEILWNVKESSRSTFAVTRIAPVGVETLNAGGTLTVNVFNNNVDPVEEASVQIVNFSTTPTIDVTAETNASGTVSFPGTPEAGEYEIYVSKDGYSSSQTYGVTAENPNPSPIHVSVVDAQTTTSSFAIDLDSVLRFFTYEPAGEGAFVDIFTNESGLLSTADVSAVSGTLVLDEDPVVGYAPSGNAFSNTVSPAYLSSWNEITFATTIPADTSLVVKLYYFDGAVYTLVPNNDLTNNNIGFSESPIDISSLDTATYTSLQLGVFLATADASSTPELLDWSLSYVAGPTPLPNVSFDIRGNRTIGTDAGGQPVYKYEDTFTTDGSAEWFIDPVEWDNFTVSLIDDDTYDIVERCPNVIAPAPGETLDVSITLDEDTAHSLRASVTNESGSPISGASVSLVGPENIVGETGSCGQMYFGDITSGSYTITVGASGYQDHTETIGISNESDFAVSLLPN